MLLLCLQEFTIIKEDAQLGRLQLYMKGRKLSSTGTLFSEGKGVHRCCHFWVVLICFFFYIVFFAGVTPGALLYLKQLDENDENIDGKRNDVVYHQRRFLLCVH